MMTSELAANELTAKLLKRPILLSGLGLTAGAWLLHGLDPGILHGSTAVWSAIAVGSGLWWVKQFWRPQAAVQTGQAHQPIDRAAVEQAIQAVSRKIDRLHQELAMTAQSQQTDESVESAQAAAAMSAHSELAQPELTALEATEAATEAVIKATTEATAVEPEIVQTLRRNLADLSQELDRKSVRLAVLGSPSVGKTTVIQALRQPDSLVSVAEITLQAGAALLPDAVNPDLVLFVVCGDLTDTEFQTIQTLLQQRYRVLIAFNKQDQYLPADRPVILQQLRDRLQGLIAAEDLVGVSAQPAPLKVRQHQADGTVEERIEQPAPELLGLQGRLEQAAAQPDPLVWATVFRQTQTLNATVQTQLNQVRRQRALPIIEQYQWIAAAAAFANPVPSLDLLATATINAQMVMDLGGLYQQQFSLEQAKTVTGSLGSQMVKLGLVEIATQAISPLLKSHALTYVAGGTVQGLSAAYLTRVAGLSLVEYFEEQSQTEAAGFQLDRLLQKLKAVFQENQRSAFLQNLVKQGLARLTPQTAQAVQTVSLPAS